MSSKSRQKNNDAMSASKAFLVRLSVDPGVGVGYDWEPEISNELMSKIVLADHLTETDLENIPKNIRVRTTECSLPDIIGGLSGPFIVSSRVRELLNVHDREYCKFIPVKISNDQFAKENVEYYFLWVSTFLDSIDVERSNVLKVCSMIPTAPNPYWKIDIMNGPRVLRRDVVGDCNIWRNKMPYINHWFLSEGFVEKLTNNAIRGWHYLDCDLI